MKYIIVCIFSQNQPKCDKINNILFRRRIVNELSANREAAGVVTWLRSEFTSLFGCWMERPLAVTAWSLKKTPEKL